MLNSNEKRPERVLIKGEMQELSCPSCGNTMRISGNVTNAQCGCGQQLNWGLRKI